MLINLNKIRHSLRCTGIYAHTVVHKLEKGRKYRTQIGEMPYANEMPYADILDKEVNTIVLIVKKNCN